MTPARLAQLQRHVATITTLDELDGFRTQLSEQQEMTTDIMAAIRDRQDVLLGRGPARRTQYQRLK
ncbi:hypothetical protein [Roseinatronobacter alkalisoli]|uniref:SlyX family protein n=1 Tax=Roseinatronobacter alkalisoli TaxID=3028235 RepID=A0ABT5TGY7_9RHOB|nr:hypothetical protein [Roseinatronobacter sp. HJB301]MDD7973427.1 hypothetical protein [Roseinatronobacter sp. HJB301]